MNDLNMTAWARELLFRQLMKHPLPWTVDQDWTFEVLDSKGACIAKFQRSDQAEEMIAAAEALQAYLVESQRKADEELRALGYSDFFDAVDKEEVVSSPVVGSAFSSEETNAHDLMHPDGPKCACGKPSFHESGACYDCYYWKQ